MRRYLSLFAAISVLCSARAYAVDIPAGPTYVSGSITTQTWDPFMAPYIVTGAITVPAGNTLTILPGVDVQFDADVQFIVQGSLHAVGTETDSIRFTRGTAAEWGGMRISGGDSSTIQYARISDGNADGASSPNHSGGAIYLSNARVGMQNSVISGNSAANYAGGVYHSGASVMLTMADCKIIENTSGTYGGGFWGYDGVVRLADCEISGNSSGYGGGAYFDNLVDATLDRCTISGNSVTQYGGGVLLLEAGCSVELTNCTVVGNTDTRFSGGVMSQNSAVATLTNCIVWGNSFADLYEDGATVNAAYSDVEGGWTGTGNINADPLFVSAVGGDYSLSEGSPCIDAGDPSSPLDPDGTQADMGAIYFDQTNPVSGGLTTTTWTSAESPYHVTDTITVLSGNTLTIEPGVDVLFNADVPFVVLGALNAVGTETDSIRFIKGAAAEWGGLQLTGGDTSVIAYARISDGNADAAGADGGGILLANGATHLTMSNSVISGNTASDDGGGVYNGGSTVVFTDCDISDNVTGVDGGGLQNYYGNMTLTGCVVEGNSNGDWGGGLRNHTGTVTLTKCSFINNNGTNRGGGVYNNDGNVTVTNCTFSGNTATSGGAIGQHNSTTTVKNSIMWGNSSAVWVQSGSAPATYSDIQGGYSGTGNINADPLFVDAANGDYSLDANSPCVDTGDPASPVDPDYTRADMGAIPYDQPYTPVSGNIYTSTWTKANSPYRVSGLPVVQSGHTLTIEAGVEVLFDVDVEFRVYGSLVANGAEGDSIVFDEGLASEWEGIDLYNGATLSYVRVSNGSANGADINGGALRLGTNGWVNASHCRFNANWGASSAGALYLNGRSTQSYFTDCTFEYNAAGSAGGAVYVAPYAVTANFTDCVFRGNTTYSSNYAYSGGAIRVYSSTANIVGCLFTGNSSIRGGAVTVQAVNTANTWAYIDRCTFAGNSAPSGGGLYISRSGTKGCWATVKNSVFWTNPGGEITLYGASAAYV